MTSARIDGHPDEQHMKLMTSKVGWRQRIDHFTWAWFTCTQSTGGIAIVMSLTPHRFNGLTTIGTIVYILNLVLFLCFVAAMVTRWILNPTKLRTSFTHPPECFFYGSFWLTFATIIIGMQQYGVSHAGPWLVVVVRILFWIYAAATFLSTTVHFVVIFKHTPTTMANLSPAVFLLIFNTMLTGTVASAIASSQPPEQRLPIIVAGVSYQGLGWIVSILLLVLFLGNLLEKGWPVPDQRPGLFMPVGSSGYTIVALIGASRAIPTDYGYFAAHPTSVDVLQIVATWTGIFLWTFTFWIFGMAFCVNMASIFAKREGKWGLQMGFKMSWWAFIFPNVGFTLATIYIGQDLESPAILWISSAMTIFLVAFWLLDMGLLVKGIITGRIMWPGEDEDKEK